MTKKTWVLWFGFDRLYFIQASLFFFCRLLSLQTGLFQIDDQFNMHGVLHEDMNFILLHLKQYFTHCVRSFNVVFTTEK